MDRKARSAQVESLKTTLHAAVDAMVERLLASFAKAEPTLEGLESALLAELHTLCNGTLGGLCEALAPRYPSAQAFCGCGGTTQDEPGVVSRQGRGTEP